MAYGHYQALLESLCSSWKSLFSQASSTDTCWKASLIPLAQMLIGFRDEEEEVSE